MERSIIHDPVFLAQPSAPAVKEDLDIATDLLDTLRAHQSECVGLAANMIGRAKCIIAVDDQGSDMVMLNPRILKKKDPYDTEEGCLSLSGTRKTKRYRSIKVQYETAEFQVRIKTFTGFTAQIIQHEMDHLSGILI